MWSVTRGVQIGPVKHRIERLDAQRRQQLAGHAHALRFGPHHGTEAARVRQAQRAAVGHQIEVVVRAGRAGLRHEGQRSRHAQVHQQARRLSGRRRRSGRNRWRAVQGQPQVFAAPRHLTHTVPAQAGRIDTQRPAQRLAQTHVGHHGVGNAPGETLSRDLDFR